MAALDQALTRERVITPADPADERVAPYRLAFRELESDLAKGPDWLYEKRRAAIESFVRLGFPTQRLEDWKFTNLSALTGAPFERARRPSDMDALEEQISTLPYARNRLVFLDGFYAPHLSANPRESLIVSSLREAFNQHESMAEQHLARYADHQRHSFIALNTAFFGDGAWVYVPGRAQLEEPIHLVYVSTTPSRRQVCHPRSLVFLEKRSQASLIETYIGPANLTAGNAGFTNAVTEIILGEESILDHYKIQSESGTTFHLATVQVKQDPASVFRSHVFSFGAALARTEVNTVLAQGSDCTLNGFYVVSGSQHVDIRTSIDHAEPHGTSHELYKGILAGRSSAVFNGKIIVRKDAQKTDAKQTNRNLVLSESATLNTKPELQIRADDVRCTHGATIGQLDQDSLFYLRSRGIGRKEAREILIAAFAREVIDNVRPDALRNDLEGILASLLTGNLT